GNSPRSASDTRGRGAVTREMGGNAGKGGSSTFPNSSPPGSSGNCTGSGFGAGGAGTGAGSGSGAGSTGAGVGTAATTTGGAGSAAWGCAWLPQPSSPTHPPIATQQYTRMITPGTRSCLLRSQRSAFRSRGRTENGAGHFRAILGEGI